MMDRTAAAMTRPSSSEAGPVAMVPRINIQAFCETAQTSESAQAAFADRRMSRAHGSVHGGGIPAAVRQFQNQSTPNLLLVETTGAPDAVIASLGALAEVCQPDTKVVVIGQVNDVLLYRELIRQGVSEYLVAPVTPLQLVQTIASLYHSEKAAPVGRVVAFIGAKGGTGSSTIAHNCAWKISREAGVETAIVDLDLAYGTAALDFNIDAAGGLLEALAQPERVDELFLDRLLIKIGDKLSLLCGPGGVDREVHIEAHAVETILTAMRGSMPQLVVDVPNVWAPWVKFTLLHADQIVLTAEPELASLANARAIVEMLKQSRPNDPPPTVVLNKVGTLKRPEISPADFAKALGAEVATIIPFDPQSFGNALNNGKMVFESAPRSKPADALGRLAHGLAGDKAAKPQAAVARPMIRKILTLGRK